MKLRTRGAGLAGRLFAALLVTAPASATPAALPEIRLSTGNAVPACVTPARLMTFLRARNPKLDPRFADIAAHYKRLGETWHVRWDYAFFQMAVETNFLSYRRPDGRMGDVDPKQNNFAGIGTTGGGVPGDAFPDIETGVLAQMQHLVVYSGEEIASPVAPRTQLKQQHILAKSRGLNRTVRFSDLARRWAADPAYGSSIAWVADSFRREQCRGKSAPGETLPWADPARSDAGAKGAPPLVAASQETPAAKTEADLPYRTIWSRDGALTQRPVKTLPLSASKPQVPPPTSSPPPASAAQGSEASPRLAQRTAPAGAPVPVLPPVVPQAIESDEDAPEGFALLSPPATLAGATAPLTTAAIQAPGAPPAPAKPAFDPPSGLGMKPTNCSFATASYGGTKAVLIRVAADEGTRYIALTVLDGFEKTLTDSYLRVRAPGGQVVGDFASKEAALAKAHELCS